LPYHLPKAGSDLHFPDFAKAGVTEIAASFVAE
jgi:hypothetical protein